MKTIKGPAIFLAQFAGDAAPFNSLAGMAAWASGNGYRAAAHAHMMLRFEGGALWCSQVAAGRGNALRLRVYGARAGLEWSQEEPGA